MVTCISLITTIYNQFTLLITVFGLILNSYCLCYQRAMPFWIFYGTSYFKYFKKIYIRWGVSVSNCPKFSQISPFLLKTHIHVLLYKLYPEFFALSKKHFLKKVLKKIFIIASFMDGVHLSIGYRATTRRKSTFYHSVPRSSCTHLIGLGRMKSWIELAAAQRFELETRRLGITHLNH